MAGKKITPKLLAEAMRILPKEKCITVLLYYFFQLSDVEIGQLLNIPRSTVQYRRTNSFERLNQFLEEHADEWMINSNIENNERGLLPYPIVLAANKGDPEAMKVVILHYGSYMTSLSMRKLRDQHGDIYWGIDEDTRDRLRSKLMQSALTFKI
ncbi:helix-turn-helix domain-containing protein [Pseudogracilibacillus sp. SO30301A]|uniref:helix-turn-helix domain-containing protein n=1 Tax=Pseudogracilibacillus sp. SO30301A TaxID=3098291 RepID=UPI003FA7C7B5